MAAAVVIALATAAAALLLAVYMDTRASRRATAPRRPSRPGPAPPPGIDDTVELKLDVDFGEPGSSAVSRLTAEAGGRVLASRPGVRAVRVTCRDGRLLALVLREMPPTHDVSIPLVLLEPRHRHHFHVPSVAHQVEGPEEPVPTQEVLAERLVRAGPRSVSHLHAPDRPQRTLTQEFDIPPAVTDRLQSDDLPGLIMATLEAAGLESRVVGDTIRAADTAIVLIPSPIGSAITQHLLNLAYMEFRSTGSASGLVVTPGLMDHTDVMHRELFVPALRHAGPDGIQRMLDAVALGGDPLGFAAATPNRGAP